MRKVIVLAAFLAAWAFMAQPAAAAVDAYTSTSLNMRAGPGGNYPVIGRISARAPVDIRGCTNNMQWCDVSAAGFRGWVAGQRLNTRYRNREANVISLGSVLGLPIVTYDQRTYWSTNYYDRDFYRARYGWNNDHSRYGWRRDRNGDWVRDSNWRGMDYDRDGKPNYRDRDIDNDGISNRYDRNDYSRRNYRHYND
jgi:uncharacterized protein YraI